MSDPFRSPEWKQFAKHVQEFTIPAMQESSIFISITPSKPGEIDIQFAVQLGAAIMLDKPIVAIVQPGAPISEKLSRVVDRFIELDLEDPNFHDRLKEVIKELVEENGQED